MKLITAIIKPFMLDKVSRMLMRSAASGFTVVEVKGYGHNEDGGAYYLNEHIKIEIVIEDPEAEHLVEQIRRSAYTAHEGNGLIWTIELTDMKRI